MKYAVLQTGGKQYKVSEGSVIEVERLEGDPNSALVLENVLFFADEGNFTLGQPFIPQAKINAKILEQKKGEKIRVSKYKAKARYRRVTGHRQLLTRLLIDKILVGSKNGSESKKSKEVDNHSIRRTSDSFKAKEQDKKANIKNANKK